MQRVVTEVQGMAGEWVERLRTLGRQAAAELLRRVGDRPAASEAEKMSFWVVSPVLCYRALFYQ